MNKKTKKRLINLAIFLILLTVEILIALFVRDDFVRPYIGDVLVVALIYFLVRILVPEGIALLPLYIFLFSAGIEMLQYFKIVERLGFQDNKIISVIIGTTFDWKDLFCYAIGCTILSISQIAYKKFYDFK